MALFSANIIITLRSQLPSLPLLWSRTLPTFQFPVVNHNKRLVSSCFNATNSAAPILATEPDVRESGWAEFAENVSGEWDGYGADFTVEGKPIELPESVVPEAYREWEVKVFDWQTQCPTLAQSHNNRPSLVYKTVKLLPTVGCEADAATVYSIHERSITSASAFAYHRSTGSYMALWIASNDKSSMELEHCLIDPSNKESRVRVIQVLELQQEDSCELKLKSISVFVESWYGPFRNGDQLGGCAVRDSAFAATRPLEAAQVSGGRLWETSTAVATFPPPPPHNMIEQLIDDDDDDDESAHKSTRDESDLILLPKQLWCSLKREAEDNTTCCEVGWLWDEGRAITSKCTFTSTALVKEIALANEAAM